ncbi:MAG: hypothetical protein K8R21_09470 [Leptospira sp.]|nr:hypothetical protein [Leptospira sp.]
MDRVYQLQKIFGLSLIGSICILLPLLHYFRSGNREKFLERETDTRYRIIEETGKTDLPDVNLLLSKQSLVYSSPFRQNSKLFLKVHFSHLDGSDFVITEWIESPPDKEFYDSSLILTKRSFKKEDIFPVSDIPALFVGNFLTIPVKGTVVRFGPFEPEELSRFSNGYLYIVRQFDGKILYKNKFRRDE